MGHDPLFDSAWAKWAQGVRHAHALQDHIDAFDTHFGRGPGLRSRTEYQAKRHGFAVIIEDVETIPVPWRLILGDAANNFHAALDHIAWALVCRGSKPPGVLTREQEGRVYFPIFDDRLKYNRSLPKKLPGVRRADVAKVRRYQPYLVGERTRRHHVLTWLTEITSGDKHRTIQPLWIEPSVIRVKIEKSRDCQPRALRTNRLRKRPLEPGAELAFVEASVEAEPSVGRRVTLREWSTRTPAFLVRVLTEFSDPPQKIVESLCNIERLAATANELEALEAREARDGLR
jgi:hypothetical protein